MIYIIYLFLTYSCFKYILKYTLNYLNTNILKYSKKFKFISILFNKFQAIFIS
ncbi:hypothetical protein QEE_0590 [Clostridioides difficile CD113]|nr:hypothetical protein QEE_0590 [Clostridioides difficile CD113]